MLLATKNLINIFNISLRENGYNISEQVYKLTFTNIVTGEMIVTITLDISNHKIRYSTFEVDAAFFSGATIGFYNYEIQSNPIHGPHEIIATGKLLLKENELPNIIRNETYDTTFKVYSI